MPLQKPNRVFSVIIKAVKYYLSFEAVSILLQNQLGGSGITHFLRAVCSVKLKVGFETKKRIEICSSLVSSCSV